MTFVTRLSIQSGDRVVLDQTVDELKQFVARKGAEMKGPHPRPPETIRVPLSKQLDPTGNRFSAWSYTVYVRDIEIIGHDNVARAVAGWDFPDSIHVAVEVEQVRSAR